MKAPTRGKGSTRTFATPRLVLEAGGRRYSVTLWDWSERDEPITTLTDLATGETFRVVNVQNRECHRRCSCSPGRANVRCEHVKFAMEVGIG